MPVEDMLGASYINAFDSNNPVGTTDDVSTLDDHIRGMKNILQQTFPALDGAVTGTPAELNKLAGLLTSAVELGYVAGVTSSIQTQIDALGTLITENIDEIVLNDAEILALQNAQVLKAPLAAPALTGAATLDGVALATIGNISGIAGETLTSTGELVFDNGLRIEWGTGSGLNDGTTVKNFANSFTTLYNLQVTSLTPGNNGVSTYSATNSGFTVAQGDVGSIPYHYLAIGLD